MAKCQSCGPNRSCCDFSSRAEQGPNLADYSVVEGILLKTWANTTDRLISVSTGEMDSDAFAERQRVLIDWLTTTFYGQNPHLQTTEGWNPHGLVPFLRETLAQWIAENPAVQTNNDEEFLRQVFRFMVEQLESIVMSALEQGMSAEAIAQQPFVQNLQAIWVGLLIGAPVEDQGVFS